MADAPFENLTSRETTGVDVYAMCYACEKNVIHAMMCFENRPIRRDLTLFQYQFCNTYTGWPKKLAIIKNHH